jgi:hypothetical protein
MATRRMLSRRISLSTKFNKLSRCSQLLYLMQIPYLDDYGCYTADPEDIKAEVLPRNNVSVKEIEESLKEMNEIGIIKLYSSEEKVYQFYTLFNKFQSFRTDRARNHEYPEFKEELVTNDIPTTYHVLPQVKLREVKLREEKLNNMQPQKIEVGEENSINQVLNVFYKSVNPMINFGNKTSRGAAQFLINKLGAEKAIKLAKYACSIQGKEFAPTITTPYELKEKFASLGVYSKRKTVNQNTII